MFFGLAFSVHNVIGFIAGGFVHVFVGDVIFGFVEVLVGIFALQFVDCGLIGAEGGG